MKSSDELLMNFARIRRTRNLLREKRSGFTCARECGDSFAPLKPCWKEARMDDGEFQLDEMDAWCQSCRDREATNTQLLHAIREHAGALRGLLRRGHALRQRREEQAAAALWKALRQSVPSAVKTEDAS